MDAFLAGFWGGLAGVEDMNLKLPKRGKEVVLGR